MIKAFPLFSELRGTTLPPLELLAGVTGGAGVVAGVTAAGAAAVVLPVSS
jgi:hypothetical protein